MKLKKLTVVPFSSLPEAADCTITKVSYGDAVYTLVYAWQLKDDAITSGCKVLATLLEQMGDILISLDG